MNTSGGNLSSQPICEAEIGTSDIKMTIISLQEVTSYVGCIVGALSVLLNIMLSRTIVYVLRKQPRQWRRMQLILNLSIGDIAGGLIIIGCSGVQLDAKTRARPVSELVTAVCSHGSKLILLSPSLSYISLGILQCIAIRKPIGYRVYFTRFRCQMIIMFQWSIVLVMTCLSVARVYIEETQVNKAWYFYVRIAAGITTTLINVTVLLVSMITYGCFICLCVTSKVSRNQPGGAESTRRAAAAYQGRSRFVLCLVLNVSFLIISLSCNLAADLNLWPSKMVYLFTMYKIHVEKYEWRSDSSFMCQLFISVRTMLQGRIFEIIAGQIWLLRTVSDPVCQTMSDAPLRSALCQHGIGGGVSSLFKTNSLGSGSPMARSRLRTSSSMSRPSHTSSRRLVAMHDAMTRPIQASSVNNTPRSSPAVLRPKHSLAAATNGPQAHGSRSATITLVYRDSHPHHSRSNLSSSVDSFSRSAV